MNVRIKEIGIRIGKDIKEFQWAILLFAVYYVLAHMILKAFCPLVIVTGIPCPACGMTRAIQFMLSGEFARSFRANPMGVPWMILGIYFVFMRYIIGKKIKYFYEILCIIIVLMLIVYIIRMKTIFPYRAPMSYTRGNILEKIIPFYKEMLRRVFDVW